MMRAAMLALLTLIALPLRAGGEVVVFDAPLPPVWDAHDQC